MTEYFTTSVRDVRSTYLLYPEAEHQSTLLDRNDLFLQKEKYLQVQETATARYFYDTFAYGICFYGIYFYGIYIYGIYIDKALKFVSIDCTVVRNTWKCKYT